MTQHDHNMGERRLARFALSDSEREQALKDYADGASQLGSSMNRQQYEQQVNQQLRDALDKIDEAKLTWPGRLRNLFEIHTPAREKAHAQGASSVAEERVEAAEKAIAGSHNRITRKLAKQRGRAYRARELVAEKVRVYDDVLVALSAKRQLLEQTRSQYEQMQELLGKDVGAEEGPKELQDIANVIEEMEKLRDDATDERDQLDTQELTEEMDRIQKLDQGLRDLLVHVEQGGFISNLNQWMLEAAAGDGTRLQEALKKSHRQGHIDDVQYKLFSEMARQLTGAQYGWGFSGEARQAERLRREALSRHHQELIRSSQQEINANTVQERAQALLRRQFGFRVNTADGANRDRWGISHFSTQTSPPAELVFMTQGRGKTAVIEVPQNLTDPVQISIRNNSSKTVTHHTLDVETDPTIDKDPTSISFRII